MQLIDKQNDLTLGGFDLFEHSLQTIFELAAIFRTGQHRTKIKSHQALIPERLRNVAGYDSLRQPFDDRRFTDAGFADQNRIVFGSSREHLNRAPDLIVPADHGIEFSLARLIGEIASVFCQRLIIRLGVLIGNSRAASCLLNCLKKIVAVNAVLSQDLSGFAIFLVDDCQQQMLGRDVLVLHLFSALLCRRKDLRKTRAEILLAALDARKTADCRFAVVLHNLDVGSQLAEQRTNDPLGLFEHCAKNVLRLDLLILISFGELDARLNRFLSAKCEFI